MTELNSHASHETHTQKHKQHDFHGYRIQTSRIHHTEVMTCLLHPAVVFASDAYLKLYAGITMLVYSWKGCFLPYHGVIYWMEGSLFCVLLLLHLSCLFLSRMQLQVLSAGLILPSIAAALYFMMWQQYVLRIEVITNAILILLQGLHAITSFL